MAPPDRSAASRARRVAMSRPWTPSRCRRAPRPPECSATALSKSPPELQRGGRNERPEAARLQPLLGVEPPLPRKTAVMARHGVLSEELRELSGDALGHLARIHEDQRRAVLAHQLGDPKVDLLP